MSAIDVTTPEILKALACNDGEFFGTCLLDLIIPSSHDAIRKSLRRARINKLIKTYHPDGYRGRGRYAMHKLTAQGWKELEECQYELVI